MQIVRGEAAFEQLSEETRQALGLTLSQPLHPEWQPGSPHCPFCNGTSLRANFHVDFDTMVTGVPFTTPLESKLRMDAPYASRDASLDVVHCNACGAAIDPLAFHHPSSFLRDREVVSRILGGARPEDL